MGCLFIFLIIYFENTTAWMNFRNVFYGKSIHWMVPFHFISFIFIWSSRIGKINLKWWKLDLCKRAWGNFLGRQKCSIIWLESWYMGIYIYQNSLYYTLKVDAFCCRWIISQLQKKRIHSKYWRKWQTENICNI